eukprot:CAMPEP_0116892180 /NCGR_PEP_ID=MMETSP0467-20121206/2459_1 /TAXON_ID=283647 /ORGANISM="Mesodinium pulex, Strain SPMC105" /LENGTH=112 /DNA_ID=CAMNT_0004561163 /DNA_START=1715 /DNA_END=2053 /DNA_ORIENTATION=+
MMFGVNNLKVFFAEIRMTAQMPTPASQAKDKNSKKVKIDFSNIDVGSMGGSMDPSMRGDDTASASLEEEGDSSEGSGKPLATVENKQSITEYQCMTNQNKLSRGAWCKIEFN